MGAAGGAGRRHAQRLPVAALSFERRAAPARRLSRQLHNYRWRLGLAEGDPRYVEINKQLAAAPTIGVPTITMEGDANGAPHPEPTAYRFKFTGRYEHRTIAGGIGHNLPQEAPHEFARAVVDVAAM